MCTWGLGPTLAASFQNLPPTVCLGDWIEAIKWKHNELCQCVSYLWTACRRTLPGTLEFCLREWRRRCQPSLLMCWSQSPRHPKTENLNLVKKTTANHAHRNVEMGAVSLWNKKKGLPDLLEALQSCRTVNRKDKSLVICACEKNAAYNNGSSLTFMMASVWMYSMSELRRPSSLPPRCVVLTIPVVTVFWRENGLPMATTNSPGLRSDDWPSFSTGSLVCKRGRYGHIVRGEKRMIHEALQYNTNGHLK